MSVDGVPVPPGRKLNASAWPLNLLSAGSPISTDTRTLQYYFVCQTKFEPTSDEAAGNARWKINFYTFTVEKNDFFNVNTTELRGAAGVQWDDNGGWFAVVSPTADIRGDYGITSAGWLYIRSDVFKEKVKEGGLIRCRYKYPNPSGNEQQDQVFSRDMTLVGLPKPTATTGQTHEPASSGQ